MEWSRVISGDGCRAGVMPSSDRVGEGFRLLARGLVASALAIASLTGCVPNAHSERIRQIRTFEAAYFQSVQQAEYARAYDALHTEVRSIITPEQYHTYFTALTDTLGPVTSWQELPNPMDRRVALFDRERRQDPLPPKNQKGMLEARYLLTFQKGQATFIIRTGWEGDRLVIRRQFLCCLPNEVFQQLRAHAIALGIGDLFGVASAQIAPSQPPAQGPAQAAPNTPGGLTPPGPAPPTP